MATEAVAINPALFKRKRKLPNPWPKVMQIARDPLRIFMLLLIVISVSRIHQHYPAIAKVRPALLATGLVAAYAFLNPRFLAQGSMFRTWPARLIIALLVIACLSVPFGMSMGNSGKFMIDVYLKTIVFAFLIVAAIRNARDLYTMSWALLLSCGILAYLAIFVFELKTYDAGYARLNDMYTYDANDTGCVLTIGIGLALLHLKTARWFGKLLSLAILIACLAAISRTGSRGALVGLMGCVLSLFLLARAVPMISRMLVIGIGVIGLSLWAPIGYWDQMSTILRPKEDYNYRDVYGRKQVAERGMGYMLSYPLFGLGINNFSKAECSISHMARNYSGGYLRCTPPHNAYVQAGAELGIPGLIVFTALILSTILGPWRLRKRMPARWKTGDAEERFLYYCTSYFPVSAGGFAVACFFLSFAWMDVTYVLPALVAGLYVSTRVKLRLNEVFPPPPPAPKKAPEWRTFDVLRRPEQSSTTPEPSTV